MPDTSPGTPRVEEVPGDSTFAEKVGPIAIVVDRNGHSQRKGCQVSMLPGTPHHSVTGFLLEPVFTALNFKREASLPESVSRDQEVCPHSRGIHAGPSG